VTTTPFGAIDPAPIQILEAAGIDVKLNPLGRRLKADEVGEVISDFDIVIAGTEEISRASIKSAANLRVICRVGIGLDGVDLVAARDQGVAVTYTPDAPSLAVAELTVGLMVNLMRGIGRADRDLRAGQWTRFTGRRLAQSTVGIIGCGRIGTKVISHLSGGFPGIRILANEIRPPFSFPGSDQIVWAGLGELLSDSDIVSIHVPLTQSTRKLIGATELSLMKPHAMLINTARGGIVDEAELASALDTRRLAGAAIDVFEEEPYVGPLARCENAILTCHMGSMTRDCRVRMEIEAATEAARFARGEPFHSPVPEAEYMLARERKQ